MKNLRNLTTYLPVKEITTADNPAISSLHMDSREVKTGGLFFCIKGYTVDGHDYAEQAVSNGACAVVSETDLGLNVPQVIVKDTKRAMALMASLFYNHPTRNFRLIGVTGTNGKTTVTHLIEEILKQNGKRTGLIGTMYTKIGEQVSDTKNTTPESLLLQQLFNKMAAAEVNTCIMEVSSHALDLGRVRGAAFNTAVFTNLSPEHLDYHGTMEAYKYAKSLLFSQLGNTYDGERQMAVLNGDDPASADFERMTAAPVLTYGIENACDLQAQNIKTAPAGTAFEIVTPWGNKTVQLALVGRFSVYNALAAAAACSAEGIPLEDVVSALEKVQGVPGRFEPVDNGQPFAVIVDYAHTPDSLENVLQTLKELPAGNRYVVVGCGGDRDQAKRPEMARIAAAYGDYAIFTSDNPRTEDPQIILQHMAAGVEGQSNVKIILDRQQAIEWAVQNARPDDVILIAGKGHETYQVVGNQVLDFDDRLEASKAIQKQGYRKGGC
ncbi:UDP-N-acetylmuramoyl-L-alanyl-D-glutamate--2,6-diaminopimelate ligase [Salibacterium aidingense]|uniref:UDP-N-acetylmuramoyl-L-alanyl-D-glutamate--2, 6-diaminopimelate ligase n=1 Tax=Salibacterium aidingense TaxID=384933 RepID=UPI0004260922|nr:UDP-N-acetylmuramoyl-L-alanyl-D-glutamate--2,6-diaminopimelate ligase [Salibacterium aidingense]